MILSMPPEIADGGYWYVLPVVVEPDTEARTPGDLGGLGWCAWYLGSKVVVRTPTPVVNLPALALPVSSYLSGSKPRGRVGGL